MSDVVVTVPKGKWDDWIAEGDLPGAPWSGYVSHFWIPRAAHPEVHAVGGDDRVYIVAHGKLRGYAPLWDHERTCRLSPRHGCLMRRGGAVAVTIPETIRGFQGWRYRWWERAAEVPFSDWRTP